MAPYCPAASPKCKASHLHPWLPAAIHRSSGGLPRVWGQGESTSKYKILLNSSLIATEED